MKKKLTINNDLTLVNLNHGEIIKSNGRIIKKTVMKESIFLCIHNIDGVYKTIITKEKYGKLFTVGDFVNFSGESVKGDKGQQLIKIDSIEILGKNHEGKKGLQFSVSENIGNILNNSEAIGILKLKYKILKHIRSILTESGYIEISTPTLLKNPGSSPSYPFVTVHKPTDKEYFLRKTLERNLRIHSLMGFHKIFEIGSAFTNEPTNANSLFERTMVEGIVSYENIKGLNESIKTFLTSIIANLSGNENNINIEEISFIDYIKILCSKHLNKNGISIDDVINVLEGIIKEKGILLNKSLKSMDEIELFSLLYRLSDKKLSDFPLLLVGNFPIDLNPFAKKTGDFRYANDFLIYYNGNAIIHGTEDETDYFKLKKSIELQQNSGKQHEYRKIDNELLELIKRGSPPTISWSFGLERFLQNFTNTSNIKKLYLL